MNKNKLRSTIQKIEKETGVTYNQIQTLFFLESILKRIAVSQYKESFIFKGGFLLASMIGIENRTTKDMDMLFSNQQFTEGNIIKIIREILNIDLRDSITFSIQETETIRDEDDYGGFRVKITCMLENIRQKIPLDIATGDPVTPVAEVYDYKTLNNQEIIKIKSYNIETIIAEKIHTIYVRGLLNSRYKDLFDIYILGRLKKDQINPVNLTSAYKNTFNYRKTVFDPKRIRETLKSISESKRMKNGWHHFRKKNTYAKDLSFSDTIEACFNIIEITDVI
ncbi:MAG TPA: nucleotidyl transferase AbiEii/AbiGii toxin family protein [Bacteroidales bacterium]|nr:nucleotidyl transferase AbiEii/AbiGii toxin family protein [Bacteroidales bacterium]HRW34686.1 nucleotidyl transferase AbiEii/AbiGii toxin family protein [Thermotogota bacterium]